MTNLQLNPVNVVTVILLIISSVTFIFTYNKAIRNRVDKSDLRDLREYIDQQDRGTHHRIDEVNNRVDKIEERIDKKLDKIMDKLSSLIK